MQSAMQGDAGVPIASGLPIPPVPRGRKTSMSATTLAQETVDGADVEFWEVDSPREDALQVARRSLQLAGSRPDRSNDRSKSLAGDRDGAPGRGSSLAAGSRARSCTPAAVAGGGVAVAGGVMTGVPTYDADASPRTQLMYHAVTERLCTFEVADLFLGQSLALPSAAELEAARKQLSDLRAQRKTSTRSRDAVAQRQSEKSSQRYRDSQPVATQRGGKYLVEPKESKEDLQKTSVSLMMVGSRAKSSKAPKATGPRS